MEGVAAAATTTTTTTTTTTVTVDGQPVAMQCSQQEQQTLEAAKEAAKAERLRIAEQTRSVAAQRKAERQQRHQEQVEKGRANRERKKLKAAETQKLEAERRQAKLELQQAKSAKNQVIAQENSAIKQEKLSREVIVKVDMDTVKQFIMSQLGGESITQAGRSGLYKVRLPTQETTKQVLSLPPISINTTAVLVPAPCPAQSVYFECPQDIPHLTTPERDSLRQSVAVMLTEQGVGEGYQINIRGEHIVTVSFSEEKEAHSLTNKAVAIDGHPVQLIQGLPTASVVKGASARKRKRTNSRTSSEAKSEQGRSTDNTTDNTINDSDYAMM